jgi:hypothetical protein
MLIARSVTYEVVLDMVNGNSNSSGAATAATSALVTHVLLQHLMCHTLYYNASSFNIDISNPTAVATASWGWGSSFGTGGAAAASNVLLMTQQET